MITRSFEPYVTHAGDLRILQKRAGQGRAGVPNWVIGVLFWMMIAAGGVTLNAVDQMLFADNDTVSYANH